MNPRLTRTIYVIHKWCGLLIGVNMLVLSITAIYILGYRASWFLSEAAETEWVPPPLIDESKRVPLQPVLDDIAAPMATFGADLRSVFPARQEGDETEFHFQTAAAENITFKMDPYKGELTLSEGSIPQNVKLPRAYEIPPPRKPRERVETPDFAAWLADWMLTLHADLFLGFGGRVFVGIVGILFFMSTLTGFIIYGPFMKALSFGNLRKKKWRFLFADAHKLIGITSLMFNLVISLSGVGITLGAMAIPWSQGRQISALQPESSRQNIGWASVDSVIETAKGSRKNWHLFELHFPDRETHPNHYLAFGAPQAGWMDIAPLISAVDAATPNVATVVPRPWWISAIIIGAPMHYGNFGGMWMRIVYLVLTVVTAALALSGFALYAMKWKRPAARGGERNA